MVTIWCEYLAIRFVVRARIKYKIAKVIVQKCVMGRVWYGMLWPELSVGDMACGRAAAAGHRRALRAPSVSDTPAAPPTPSQVRLRPAPPPPSAPRPQPPLPFPSLSLSPFRRRPVPRAGRKGEGVDNCHPLIVDHAVNLLQFQYCHFIDSFYLVFSMSCQVWPWDCLVKFSCWKALIMSHAIPTIRLSFSFMTSVFKLSFSG